MRRKDFDGFSRRLYACFVLWFLPGCLQKADLVFLLDSSSTIGKDNFRKLEDFLKDVVQDLNISPDGVHVGLMQYSSYPSLEFPLDMHTSRYDVLKAIDNVSGGCGWR